MQRNFGAFAILCIGRLILHIEARKFLIGTHWKMESLRNQNAQRIFLIVMLEIMPLWSSAWSTWMHWHCCKLVLTWFMPWLCTFVIVKVWLLTSKLGLLVHKYSATYVALKQCFGCQVGCLCIEKNNNIVCCRFMTVFTVILGQSLWVLDASTSVTSWDRILSELHLVLQAYFTQFWSHIGARN